MSDTIGNIVSSETAEKEEESSDEYSTKLSENIPDEVEEHTDVPSNSEETTDEITTDPPINKKRQRDSENDDDVGETKHDNDYQTAPKRLIVESPEGDMHASVVANHYNALEEKGLSARKKSKIYFMRNFNNWIKSMLINEYITKIRDSNSFGAPIRVLDMCCGKGGDLLKWQKGNVTHVICTDIAAVSVEQCESRYKTMASSNDKQKIFTAEFFHCDATINRLREKYKDPSIDLNLVSCQFAFHYCFESLPQAECMLRNASECLKEGGYFIGTIPDAHDIMKRQRKADANSFGNNVYNIEFLCDTVDVPLFGAKYNFKLEEVVDCPEFLVHFPTLIKLAEKFGLQLICRERFEDFFDRMLASGKPLLERMKGLETYPAYNRNDLTSSDEIDYEHAKLFLESKGGNSRNYNKVGTLSKQEWEAASLYMVFAFRKMKKTWNASGEAEYVKIVDPVK